MKFSVMLLVLMSAVACSAGGLKVTTAYYRETNLSLHVVVANGGSAPVKLLPPVVNGYDTAGLANGLKQGDPVLWHACRPSAIPAGGRADLIITLAAPLTKAARVEIRDSSGASATADIPCAPERFRLQAVRFDRDLRTFHIYARWTDAKADDALKKILLDGRDVTKLSVSRHAQNTDGLAYIRIKLPAALTTNSYHVIEAQTEDGLRTGYGIRAIPAEFLIGIYGSPSEENIADWAAHGINHYLSFGAVSPGILQSLAAKGLTVGAKYIGEPVVDRTAGKVVRFDQTKAAASIAGVAASPNLLYHHLVDEPDAADYYAGHLLGASGMELATRAQFCEEQDPGRYTMVQLDNTFRPQNYRVYGESADVLGTHRYSLGSFINSEAGEKTVKRLAFLPDMQETLTAFRLANEPKPFFMITQFFNLGVGRSGRPPVVDEMRMQCYAMIAGGARGLIHYIHSGSGGGHEGGRTPELWDGMTGLHAELMRLSEVASVGTPAPVKWCRSDSPQLSSSLVLGGDRMAVILLNLAHRSALGQFTVLPVTGAHVTVVVPPWMNAHRYRIVPADGGKSTVVQVEDGAITFTVDRVGADAGYVIEPRN